MIVKELTVGPIMANCFIVGCEETKNAAVIDPGDEADRILMTLAESALTVKYIINTHGHFDHVSANKRLKDVTGADILIHPLDAPMLSQLSAAASAWVNSTYRQFARHSPHSTQRSVGFFIGKNPMGMSISATTAVLIRFITILSVKTLRAFCFL